MEEANLPEEIIVLIFSFLPEKSLIRFMSVSKCLHSIILSDSEFAKSQLQAAHRQIPNSETSLLLKRSSIHIAGLDDAVIWRSFFRQKTHIPDPATGWSCLATGLLHATVLYFSLLVSTYFMCGTLQLVSSRNYLTLVICRLPMTTEYSHSRDYINDNDEAAMSRAHSWKSLEVDVSSIISIQGTLLKEALHWLNDQDEIVAFDLEKQEDHRFRKCCCHISRTVATSISAILEFLLEDACLSLVRSPKAAADCIHLWVMRENGLRGSWTKLYNLKFSDSPKELWEYSPVLVMETCIVTDIFTGGNHTWLVILHKEDKLVYYS